MLYAFQGETCSTGGYGGHPLPPNFNMIEFSDIKVVIKHVKNFSYFE